MRLPDGFTVGVASAALQVEGSSGTRGTSTWDVFADDPSRILDGSTPAIATDSYARWADDLALLQDLGVDAYRFSTSWSRVVPDGAHVLNQDALDHYSRMVDDLLEAGIRPMVTLFHWDTPAPLEDRGGWLRRATAERFAEYAQVVGERLGDRVADWVTLNEPATVLLNGYGLGIHAPGRALVFKAIPAVRNMLVAHGLAVQALRSVPVRGRIGITNVHTPTTPATDSADDAAAADALDFLHNRLFADPVLSGRRADLPAGASRVERLALGWWSRIPRRDLGLISQPLDFYGLNYYFPSRVAAGADDTGASPDGEAEAMRDVPFHLTEWPGARTTAFGWPVVPEGLTDLLQRMRERYDLPPIVITENGTSTDEDLDDPERIAFLRDHLEAAIAGGAEGLYVWTLLDNWEWAAGFTQRFGLVHVDHATQVRTRRASYAWLRDLLADRRAQ